MISTKFQSNFIENALQHGYSPVNLLHIFGTPFYKNQYEGLFLTERYQWYEEGQSMTDKQGKLGFSLT